jgi:hypothetical protein
MEEAEDWIKNYFQGKEEYGSKLKSYQALVEFFEGLQKAKANPRVVFESISACIIMLDHPAKFVITGQAKTGVGASKLADEVSDVLPKLTAEEKANWEDPQSRAFDEKRKGWGAFTEINLTKVRMIALAGRQYLSDFLPQAKRSNAYWGSRPLEYDFDRNPKVLKMISDYRQSTSFNKLESECGKRVDILMEQIEAFKREDQYRESDPLKQYMFALKNAY